MNTWGTWTDSIIRGTTPTLKYMFREVPVDDIDVAYLTIRMDDEVIIEKNINDATIGKKYISWTLTQQESLSMTKSEVICQLNWKLSNGIRGASEQIKLAVKDNDKEVVI